MKKQHGQIETITTVGELKKFIADIPVDVEIDIGWCDPIEILVMKDCTTGKLTLNLSEV